MFLQKYLQAAAVTLSWRGNTSYPSQISSAREREYRLLGVRPLCAEPLAALCFLYSTISLRQPENKCRALPWLLAEQVGNDWLGVGPSTNEALPCFWLVDVLFMWWSRIDVNNLEVALFFRPNRLYGVRRTTQKSTSCAASIQLLMLAINGVSYLCVVCWKSSSSVVHYALVKKGLHGDTTGRFGSTIFAILRLIQSDDLRNKFCNIGFSALLWLSSLRSVEFGHCCHFRKYVQSSELFLLPAIRQRAFINTGPPQWLVIAKSSCWNKYLPRVQTKSALHLLHFWFESVTTE